MSNKVIWMTGLSGAGKTTIAMAASKALGVKCWMETLSGTSSRIATSTERAGNVTS